LAEQLHDLTVKAKSYHTKSLAIKVGRRGATFEDSIIESFGRK
jgi:hypothetical protein